MKRVFQSTLPRGSDFRHIGVVASRRISIHAPSRERQKYWKYSKDYYIISIHAPSRERRKAKARANCDFCHFNPRSLAGATAMAIHFVRQSRFQSTLPRGSDQLVYVCVRQNRISIHAPSRERHKYVETKAMKVKFQSTLPRGSDLHERF